MCDYCEGLYDDEDLSSVRDQFHRADKRAAVLDEKLKVNAAFEILSGGCLAIGAAAMGPVHCGRRSRRD